MKDRCVACGLFGVVDRAHLKTRGAGAGWGDDEWIALCRMHHVEQGQSGWHRFLLKYPAVADAIEKRGWEVREIFGVFKLVRKETTL
jgi:hypothetical protein